MRSALYAGSFDPFTYGHLDVVKRACRQYDRVTVGLAENSSKKYMFSREEKRRIIERTLKDADLIDVDVQYVDGLVADYANIMGFSAVIKGARTAEDFNMERLINDVSLTQQANMETVIYPSHPSLSHVSSSAVKELAKYQGLTHGYVPLHTKSAIEDKQGQLIIGVTGVIGAGKSTFCSRMVEVINSQIEKETTVHHVDADKIGHLLLLDSPLATPLARLTQRRIQNQFGTSDRKSLGSIVFGNTEKLSVLNKIMREPMLTLLRDQLSKLKGVILLEGALLMEMDWMFLTSNRVIIVTPPSDHAVYMKRLLSRGMTHEQAHRRINSQFSNTEKINFAEKKIHQDSAGWCITVDPTNIELTSLFVRIMGNRLA